MRVRSLAPWAVVLVLVVLLLAAGCGGGSSSAESPAPAAVAANVSADQVVKDSEARMVDVNSASFVADMGLTIQGDTTKMTDPTAKALLSGGITVHAEGASSNDPTAMDMTVSLGIAGQTLELGMMTQGKSSWVEYQGQWYKMDAKSSKSLDKQAKVGASPTEQLKSLGLDPSSWGTTYSMVGQENIGSTPVYHVKATADPKKVAAALLKASQDPSLAKKLGGQDQLKQLGESLTQNKQQTQELADSLKQATVDYWIGVNDDLMYKAEFAGSMDTKGQKDMSGVDGMTMKMTLSMSNFDQPVTVTPPANALPLNKLIEQMFGGMTSGMTF
jgi:hypothetical protein